jgi:hypothetical protein
MGSHDRATLPLLTSSIDEHKYSLGVVDETWKLNIFIKEKGRNIMHLLMTL